MSTRGFVGVGELTSWDACYNHSDSSPKRLGSEVWQVAQDFLRHDGHLRKFAQHLRVCTEWGQMVEMIADSNPASNLPHPANSLITSTNVDWLHMEWGYIVDPATNILHIFAGLIETPVIYNLEYIRPDGRHDTRSGQSRYTGVLVASWDLQEAEPDWAAVEQTGEAMREYWDTAFANNPHHPLLDSLRYLPTLDVHDQRES